MDSDAVAPSVIVEELETLEAFFVRRRLEVVKRLNAAQARIAKARQAVGPPEREAYTVKGHVMGYSGQRCGQSD